MAPLKQSKKTQFVKRLDKNTTVFQATLDPEWTISTVPFGGYTLTLVLNAAMQSQATTPHPDPFHVNLQFLNFISVSEVEIHVITIRVGKQFSNLSVDLIQVGDLKARASMIFGNLSPAMSAGPSYPESHLPIAPLVTHPSLIKKLLRSHRFRNYAKRYKWAEDPHYAQQNKQLEHSRNADGLISGVWVELLGNEPVEADEMGFFMDTSRGPIALLPDGQREQATKIWYPTLNITIEFKTRFPLDSSFAPATFAVFSRFRHTLNGRYNDTVEIWTAPSSIGSEGGVDEKWREKMVCVAVGGQMGLLVPMTANKRHAQKGSKL